MELGRAAPEEIPQLLDYDGQARRKFLAAYERKYKFDMKEMKQDILSMKEPVFAVRPRVVFGLWEKHFVEKSTRWKFE